MAGFDRHRAVSREHVLAEQIVVHLGSLEQAEEVEEPRADVAQSRAVPLMHPGGGGGFDYDDVIDLFPADIATESRAR